MIDILTEIKKLKVREIPDTSHGVENPHLYFEGVYAEVMAFMERHCKLHGVSRAEFITQLEKSKPAEMVEFWRLHDLINCDVYGKWCYGELTQKDLERFYQNLGLWRDYSRQLFLEEPNKERRVI